MASLFVTIIATTFILLMIVFIGYWGWVVLSNRGKRTPDKDNFFKNKNKIKRPKIILNDSVDDVSQAYDIIGHKPISPTELWLKLDDGIHPPHTTIIRPDDFELINSATVMQSDYRPVFRIKSPEDEKLESLKEKIRMKESEIENLRSELHSVKETIHEREEDLSRIFQAALKPKEVKTP